MGFWESGEITRDSVCLSVATAQVQQTGPPSEAQEEGALQSHAQELLRISPSGRHDGCARSQCQPRLASFCDVYSLEQTA